MKREIPLNKTLWTIAVLLASLALVPAAQAVAAPNRVGRHFKPRNTGPLTDRKAQHVGPRRESDNGLDSYAQAEAPVPPYTSISWYQLPNMPQSMSGNNIAWIDGKLVVTNGSAFLDGTEYRGTLPNQFIEYDPATNAWSNIPMSPTGVAWTGSVSANNSLYVFGGLLQGTDTCTALSYRLTHDAGGYQWTQIQSLPNTWWAGSGDSTALIGSKAYLVGGAYYNDPAYFTNDLVIADLNGDSVSYSYGASIPGPARYAIAAGAAGGKVYAFGGNTIEPREDNVVGEAYCYDPVADSWTQIADLPLERYGAAAVGLDDRYVAIIGGYYLTREVRSTRPDTDGFLSDVLIYDTQENTYTQSDPLPIPELLGGDYQGVLTPAALQVEGNLYVVGGEPSRARDRTSIVHSTYEPPPPPPPPPGTRGASINGVQVFFDDFEGITPTGGDDDPVATTGTWNISEPTADADVQVVSGSSPGAYEGSSCLSITRAGSGGGTRPDAFAAFSTAPRGGDNVHAEFMVYMKTGNTIADAYCMDINASADTLDPLHTMFNRDTTDADGEPNEIWASGGGFGQPNIDTGLRATFDVWEKWEIDYIAGAATFTLTVGGNSVVIDLRNEGIPLSLNWRGGMTGGEYWLDATAEALLGDANGDGVVDFGDYMILESEFGTAGSQADFDNNGVVDFDDYMILESHFGEHTP